MSVGNSARESHEAIRVLRPDYVNYGLPKPTLKSDKGRPYFT
jgi:hypothetical protein